MNDYKLFIIQRLFGDEQHELYFSNHPEWTIDSLIIEIADYQLKLISCFPRTIQNYKSFVHHLLVRCQIYTAYMFNPVTKKQYQITF